MKNFDKRGARIAGHNTFSRVKLGLVIEDTRLFIHYRNNPFLFEKYMNEPIFGAIYQFVNQVGTGAR
jgi:hypothetical protein